MVTGDDAPTGPASDSTPLRLAVADGVATLTLARPAALNALSRALVATLYEAVRAVAARADVRVVVLCGAGERAFCTGADLKERAGLDGAARAAHTAQIAAAADALAALPVPTIAALHGYTLAGGLELALACDIRLAAADTVCGLTEVRIGIFPGAGAPARLPRLVGSGKAAHRGHRGAGVWAGGAGRPARRARRGRGDAGGGDRRRRAARRARRQARPRPGG